MQTFCHLVKRQYYKHDHYAHIDSVRTILNMHPKYELINLDFLIKFVKKKKIFLS